MLGCFHLVSPVHLSFLYYPFAKASQMFSRTVWADKEAHLLYEGALPCSAQGEQWQCKHWQQQWALKGHLRSLELEGKDTAPKWGSYITGGAQTGATHHENALQWEVNSSHMPMEVARECAPLLTLRWHVSNSMAEGTDVPSAGSWEVGWMPIQMPLEFGFWVFFFL